MLRRGQDVAGAFDRRPLRILLTEGASTSARQTVTALALRGHHIEVCDPDAHCLCRFSSFVRRFHRCPGIGADPLGYLDFTVELLETGRYDVLLPIHEQGLVFAKARKRLPPVGLALPSYEAYAQALSKASFSQLLLDLGIAQPRTVIVRGLDDLASLATPPFVLKRPIATASRGVWMIRRAADFDRARAAIGGTADELLFQEMLSGPVEHAQAVFDRGRLVGTHAFRQIALGAGGGAARKESVIRPRVRADLARIGARLAWHGALSVDYILHGGVPHYIDSNPRLVEPMSGVFAGVDLVDLLLRVSLGEPTAEAPSSRAGVRTHIAMQALFGTALRSSSRIAILREAWRLLRERDGYRGSSEELTPLRADWLSALPLASATLALIAFPGASKILPKKGWGAGLLTPESIRTIREMHA
jgi:predicted ATP-grasp superfamily ATP-dependent carboligase